MSSEEKSHKLTTHCPRCDLKINIEIVDEALKLLNTGKEGLLKLKPLLFGHNENDEILGVIIVSVPEKNELTENILDNQEEN